MERRTFLMAAAATAALSTTSSIAISESAAAAAAATMGPLLDPWTGANGGVPRFDKITAPQFKPAFTKSMNLLRAEVDAITANKAPATFDNTVLPFEDAGRPFGRVSTLFGVYTSTMNDKTMQGIETEMSPVLSEFGDEIIQNDALFQRLKAVNDARATSNLNAEQQRVTEVYYNRFARQGAGLSKEQKSRLKDINQKLASLFTTFRQNQLSDEETYTLTLDSEADLAGLPPPLRDAAAQAAKEHKQPGKWVLTNTRSSMEPFLAYSDRRDLREKGWRMWNARGNNQNEHNNRSTASEILKLRAERAKLLGFPTHAHWIVDDNMAKTPDAAMGLMMKVWKAAVARVKEEVADMQAIADKEGAKITIEPWDYRYYAEKVRKAKYDIDQNEVKQYFQLEKIREGMFWAAGQVYGLEFVKLSGIPVYHRDMSVYEVRRGGNRVGLWYFDPYARSGKSSGAWMNEYRTQEKFKDTLTPVVSNNSNFIKGKPGEPVLISWDDANTMFHEFGHALHGLLSNVTYPTLAGTNVKRDFVEFPSQVNEYWLATPEVLNQFAVHYQTGKPIPKALVDKVLAAQNFNQGFETVEYLANAIYDMKIHLAATPDKSIDIAEFERTTMAEIGMPKEMVLRHPAAAFGHIFSSDGYSAGYYVYIWADAMTADVYEGFQEKGGLYNKDACKLLEASIMSVGNSIPPDQAFRRFRGRDVDTNALMRDRGFPVS
ncbi:MAG: M3 family metallopeptidase [Alphaproteobacteria bacterium]|nr:M3 family metallopeptidase [Alphaproteobacteria bacterium]